jgi:hypothetical protein
MLSMSVDTATTRVTLHHIYDDVVKTASLFTDDLPAGEADCGGAHRKSMAQF